MARNDQMAETSYMGRVMITAATTGPRGWKRTLTDDSTSPIAEMHQSLESDHRLAQLLIHHDISVSVAPVSVSQPLTRSTTSIDICADLLALVFISVAPTEERPTDEQHYQAEHRQPDE